ncbi:MAG: hypothetical protein EA426_12470 [Spirochaetaceae bacterium]|nr:MAG: hypothetical protein EA426_12470 [Spirochaetaceae bacterium]
MTIIGWLAVAAGVLFVVITAVEHAQNRALRSVPGRPPQPVTTEENRLLEALARADELSVTTTDEQIEGICSYIDLRYDCSDFRAISLLRILYEYNDCLTAGQSERIETCLASFKYWLDEPGDDSMCYWSENHQILFAACEFLAGNRMPDRVFSNDGRTGREHAARARTRILMWLELRWRYGFTEWYSSVYYTEDVAALVNLIDFAGDPEIEQRCSIVLDLLLYDIASQSFRGVMVSSSGRLYEAQKKRPDTTSLLPVLRELRGEPVVAPVAGMIANFVYRSRYRIPEVLKRIARYDGELELLASHGLDLSELRPAGLIGVADRQIMVQWGMESFSNPETLANTMRAFRRFRMFRQAPFRALAYLRLTVLKLPGLYRLLSLILQPQSNGIAIERANTYTYKTSRYLLATAQAYHPGSFGDQHHVWHGALSPTACAFTTHPATLPGERAPFGNSPGYWVGSGRLPHSVQHRTVNLTMYDLPKNAGPLSGKLLGFTHAWLPESEFDEVRRIESGLVARLGDAYLALLCAGPFEYRTEPTANGEAVRVANEAVRVADEAVRVANEAVRVADGAGARNEVVQTGLTTGWVCTVSSMSDGETYSQFLRRLETSRILLSPRSAAGAPVLEFATAGREYRLEFGGEFLVDGTPVSFEYPRSSSPFCSVPREPATVEISWERCSLRLEYEAMVRVTTHQHGN